MLATNVDYAFWLARRAEETELQLREVLPINELTRKHFINRSLVRRLSHPDYLYRDKLLEVVEMPYFELISVEPEPTEAFPNLYRVAFNYEHEYVPGEGGIFNWPQKCTMWLDADNCWVMVRCQVKNKLVSEEKDTSYTEQVFEFEPINERDDAIRLHSRRTEYFDLDSNWNRDGAEQYVTDYELIPSGSFDRKSTRLSYYGFAEPVFDVPVVNDTVEIQIDQDQLTVAANDYGNVPFTLRNISSEHVTLVRVIAC